MRVVDIAADAGCEMGIFEKLYATDQPAKLADGIRGASAIHYGHAGRAFLRRLVADLDGTRQAVKRHVSQIETSWCPPAAGGQVKRVAKRFALVAAAGELATSWGILPWPAGTAEGAVRKLFAEWLEARGTAEPLETTNALQRMQHIIETEGPTRFQVSDGDRSLSGGPVYRRLGFVKRGDGEFEDLTVGEGETVADRRGRRDIYYFFPGAFKTEVCKGMSHKTMIAALRKTDALIADAGRDKKQCRFEKSERGRYYAVDADKL
jgi:uncharacterized protein (DUF927 family)